MALVNMARTKEEVKKEQKSYELVDNAPKYPYGLCIRLDAETMKKLGIAVPEGGAKMRVDAVAVVTSVNTHEEVDGDKKSHVELQITDLAITPEEGTSKSEMASKLYG